MLTTMVLAAAGLYAVQWYTLTKLQDNIIGSGLSIAPYTQSVSEFVDGAHRWPTINEVTLPAPPAGGSIRKVAMGEQGVLTFTLSAWTFHGRVTVTFAPHIATGAMLEPKARLSYACVAVNPASLVSVVCRQWGLSSLEEIEARHAQEFSDWQADVNRVEDRQTAVAAAENTETECDRIVARVSDSTLECVSRIDAGIGSRFAKVVAEKFRNRPRLRAEVIAESPDLLANYNNQCTEDWAQIVAQMTTTNHEIANCL